MSRNPSDLEERERMLDIIAGVGARGFLLTEPDCSLILEGIALIFRTTCSHLYMLVIGSVYTCLSCVA